MKLVVEWVDYSVALMEVHVVKMTVEWTVSNSVDLSVERRVGQKAVWKDFLWVEKMVCWWENEKVGLKVGYSDQWKVGKMDGKRAEKMVERKDEKWAL
jgi:hypothetical protein